VSHFALPCAGPVLHGGHVGSFLQNWLLPSVSVSIQPFLSVKNRKNTMAPLIRNNKSGKLRWLSGAKESVSGKDQETALSKAELSCGTNEICLA
jgi:hypothetical protein